MKINRQFLSAAVILTPIWLAALPPAAAQVLGPLPPNCIKTATCITPRIIVRKDNLLAFDPQTTELEIVPVVLPAIVEFDFDDIAPGTEFSANFRAVDFNSLLIQSLSITGFDNPIAVLFGQQSQQIAPPQTVDFSKLPGLPGGGVSELTIAGFTPSAPTDKDFFSVTAVLEFSSTTAVPEPSSTLGILAFGVLGTVAVINRQRKSVNLVKK